MFIKPADTFPRVLILESDTSRVPRLAAAAKRWWGDIQDFSLETHVRDWAGFQGVLIGPGFYYDLRDNPPTSAPVQEIVIYEEGIMGHKTLTVLKEALPGTLPITRLTYASLDER